MEETLNISGPTPPHKTRQLQSSNSLWRDAPSSVQYLPGQRLLTSGSPAFNVTRYTHLSPATAQAAGDTACCDPAALALQVTSAHACKVLGSLKRSSRLLVWVAFVFKQPSVELLSETETPAASSHRGEAARGTKALRLSALRTRVPEDLQQTDNPMETKAALF